MGGEDVVQVLAVVVSADDPLHGTGVCRAEGNLLAGLVGVADGVWGARVGRGAIGIVGVESGIPAPGADEREPYSGKIVGELAGVAVDVTLSGLRPIQGFR